MQTIETTFTTEVASYLRDHFSVTLSTASFTGLPHANTAAYVSDDQRIYFFAREGSVLLRNLATSHHAAFTIDEYSSTWGKRRELHGNGVCALADDSQSGRARELAAAKFGRSLPGGVVCSLVPSGMYFVEYET